ncbi:MGMT family protein [Candidatus Mcinerneyibacteriota bacterium]|nr:MGMT family protein [Candidatus Mcinerneyibacteriota bacterium]
MNPLTERIIQIIQTIPRGRVATYGGVAACAGNPKAARQVARILHTCSRSHHLPWHRVVGSGGRIVLKGGGFEEQKRLLEKEGVKVSNRGLIDMESFGTAGPDEGPLI